MREIEAFARVSEANAERERAAEILSEAKDPEEAMLSKAEGYTRSNHA